MADDEGKATGAANAYSRRPVTNKTNYIPSSPSLRSYTVSNRGQSIGRSHSPCP